MSYVLISAARNERHLIEFTIRSVIAQNCLPEQWVIASDCSNDGTDELVRWYSKRHRFITLVRIENTEGRSFASQANALNRAMKEIQSSSFRYVGCLDADISLEPDYYERIMEKFLKEPLLGVAGGFIYEKGRNGFSSRPCNSQRSVAGAIQMFRRECFERIGGFTPIPYGGLDTVAEIKAQMFGYRVQSFPQLRVYHHRRTGGERKLIHASFTAGLMDYAVGYHPLYELFCCAHRLRDGVPVLGALVRYIGFSSQFVLGRHRIVSARMISFLRAQQKDRMKYFMKRILSWGVLRS